MKTLEEIIKKEEANRCEGGQFGITACKECIQWEAKRENKSLYTILEEYVERANRDVFFNRAMILACWEMINGR